MLFTLSKAARVSLLLGCAVLAPLVLNAVYVLALRGQAASPFPLHEVCKAVIVFSCVPVVIAMPMGRVSRFAVAAVLLVGGFFTVSGIGFWMCVQFGYPP